MVYVILGTGFEEIEAVAPVDILRRAGIEVAFAGVDGLKITGAHNIDVCCDITVSEIDADNAEMLVVPGGLGGVNSIKASREAMGKIDSAYKNGVALAAICAGPTVLNELGILDGVKAVCYPGMEEEMPNAKFESAEPVCRDGRIITGRGPGTALEFGFALLDYLKGSEAVAVLKKSMVCG